MSDQSNAKGNLHLPEMQTMDQVINTLKDQSLNDGLTHMATCVHSDNLCFLVVSGNMRQISLVSRLLATLREQPLVKIPGH